MQPHCTALRPQNTLRLIKGLSKASVATLRHGMRMHVVQKLHPSRRCFHTGFRECRRRKRRRRGRRTRRKRQKRKRRRRRRRRKAEGARRWDRRAEEGGGGGWEEEEEEESGIFLHHALVGPVGKPFVNLLVKVAVSPPTPFPLK